MDPVIQISSPDSCPYSDFIVNRAARSKSAGNVVLRKIAKKLSRISVKGGRGGGGGGGGRGGTEEEYPEQERGKEPAEKMEKFKRGLMRSSRSTSNLDSMIDRWVWEEGEEGACDGRERGGGGV